MKKRIGNPPDGVELPIWAWYQWEGVRKRPDMRHHGRSGEKGVPVVLMTVDVPYDENAVYSKEERQKSWENIFDYECTFNDRERTIGLSTQATMWEIKAECVLKVEHFKTR